MAKEFFKDLPDTTTPITASRLNGLLDGEEALGNIVVDSIRSKNLLDVSKGRLGTYNGVTIAYDTNYKYLLLNGTSTNEFDIYEVSSDYNNELKQYINSNIGDYVLSNNLGLTNYIQTTDGYHTNTATITNSNQFLRCFIRIPSGRTFNNTILKIQLETGSTATIFSPFQELNPDNFKNEEIVVGSIRTKNMFSFKNNYVLDTVSYRITNNNTFNQTNTGAYARSSWEITGLETGKTYTLSCNYTNSNSCSIRLSIYNSTNTTLITETSATTSTSGNFTLTFTASETTIYIRFYSNTTSSGNTNSVTFSNIQLEEGSSLSNFMPNENLFLNDYYLLNTQESRLYTKFMNTGSSSSLTIQFLNAGGQDRQFLLIFGSNGSLQPVGAVITRNNSSNNIKNFGTVSLSLSSDVSNNRVTINGLSAYSYLTVISSIDIKKV